MWCDSLSRLRGKLSQVTFPYKVAINNHSVTIEENSILFNWRQAFLNIECKKDKNLETKYVKTSPGLSYCNRLEVFWYSNSARYIVFEVIRYAEKKLKIIGYDDCTVSMILRSERISNDTNRCLKRKSIWYICLTDLPGRLDRNANSLELRTIFSPSKAFWKLLFDATG